MTAYWIVAFALVMVAGCTTPAPDPAHTKAEAAAPPRAAPPAQSKPGTATPPKAATAAPPKAATAAPPKAATAAPPKAAPAAASAKAVPPLDLKSLESRLRETSAIGVLTKLSLKNQVDDLIARFKAFHDGHRPPTLTELRPAFELLIMKALSLLQDHDKALANDINASREAIWGVLTDRQKLSTYL